MAPAYIEVAEAVASDPNLVIAEMDATANEVYGHLVSSFPKVKFYPSDDKHPALMSAKKATVENIMEFLEDRISDVVEFDFDLYWDGEPQP